MVKNSKTDELEENYVLSDFYLVRDFTDSELRLLIGSLLFSKHILCQMQLLQIDRCFILLKF